MKTGAKEPLKVRKTEPAFCFTEVKVLGEAVNMVGSFAVYTWDLAYVLGVLYRFREKRLAACWAFPLPADETFEQGPVRK
jgi:hypothetical protein